VSRLYLLALAAAPMWVDPARKMTEAALARVNEKGRPKTPL
jgi:hypothetical protein